MGAREGAPRAWGGPPVQLYRAGVRATPPGIVMALQYYAQPDKFATRPALCLPAFLPQPAGEGCERRPESRSRKKTTGPL